MMSQRDRVIEQAMEMFISQGIKSVRMDDIAQTLGVSKRTIYEMFGGKDELLFLAIRLYFEQEKSRHAEKLSQAENIIEALFVVLEDVMEHSENTYRMMNNLKKFYPEVYRKLLSCGAPERREQMRKQFEQGVEKGLMTDNINFDLAVSMLHYMTTAVVTRSADISLPSLDEVSVRDAFVQVLVTFYRGISTPKGMKMIDDYIAQRGLMKKI